MRGISSTLETAFGNGIRDSLSGGESKYLFFREGAKPGMIGDFTNIGKSDFELRISKLEFSGVCQAIDFLSPICNIG